VNARLLYILLLFSFALKSIASLTETEKVNKLDIHVYKNSLPNNTAVISVCTKKHHILGQLTDSDLP